VIAAWIVLDAGSCENGPARCRKGELTDEGVNRIYERY